MACSQTIFSLNEITKKSNYFSNYKECDHGLSSTSPTQTPCYIIGSTCALLVHCFDLTLNQSRVQGVMFHGSCFWGSITTDCISRRHFLLSLLKSKRFGTKCMGFNLISTTLRPSKVFFPWPIEIWLSLSHDVLSQSAPSVSCYLK